MTTSLLQFTDSENDRNNTNETEQDNQGEL